MTGPADSSVPLDSQFGYPDDFQILTVRVATQGSVYLPTRDLLWVADRDLIIDNAWIRTVGAEGSQCRCYLAFAPDGTAIGTSTDIVTAPIDLSIAGNSRTEFALDPNYRLISKGDAIIFRCDDVPAAIQTAVFGFRVRSLTG